MHSPGFDSVTVRPVESRYTDHAIPAHKEFIGGLRNYSILKTPVLHVAIESFSEEHKDWSGLPLRYVSCNTVWWTTRVSYAAQSSWCYCP